MYTGDYVLTENQKRNIRSKSFRMANLYRIRSKSYRYKCPKEKRWITQGSKMIVFRKNKAQQAFDENRHTRNVILKSRQLGMTTFEAIDMLDDMCFTPNFNGLFIAHQKDAAEDIFDGKIRLAWDHFKLAPCYYLDMMRTDKIKIGFLDGPNKKYPQNGQSYSSIEVKTSGRSGTYSRLHISELGKMASKFPDRAREVMIGTIPAMPDGARIDVESTAEGEGGPFYELFWGAYDEQVKNPNRRLADSEYRAHFFNWRYDVDEIKYVEQRDMDLLLPNMPSEFRDYQKMHKLSDKEITYWYQKWISLSRNWDALFQEYPTTPEEAFRYSGKKLFSSSKISEQQKAYVREPKRVQNGWRIYEDYRPGHTYALGADVSEGIGASSSTVVVIDFTPSPAQVVAVYENNSIAPDLFAYEVRNGSEMYGGCLTLIERNNNGVTTIDTLKRMYPVSRIYKEPRIGERKKGSKRNRLGWHTNGKTKPKMMYEMQTALDEDSIEIPDRQILKEMRTFNTDDILEMKADPDQTDHWDTLIAMSICWQARDVIWRGGTDRRARRPSSSVILTPDSYGDDGFGGDVFGVL